MVRSTPRTFTFGSCGKITRRQGCEATRSPGGTPYSKPLANKASAETVKVNGREAALKSALPE